MPVKRVVAALVLACAALASLSPVESTALAAPGPLPSCTYVDVATRYASVNDWYRSVVDTRFRIAATYAPRDLVPVTRSGAPGTGSVRSIIMPDLTAMFRAAKAAGAPFAVISAYRSYSYQVSTFNGWVRQAGLARARLASARPGHSEHQLGTSMDLTGPASVVGTRVTGIGRAPWLYADWGTTRAGAWLRNNAWRYGFVMSYPKVGSPQKTCYKYEPWHFRYVGRVIAALIHASGLTPREWLWQQGDGSTWTGPIPAIGGSGGPGAAPPPDDAPAPPTDTIGPMTIEANTLPVVVTGGVGLVAFAFLLWRPAGRRHARRHATPADAARTGAGLPPSFSNGPRQARGVQRRRHRHHHHNHGARPRAPERHGAR